MLCASLKLVVVVVYMVAMFCVERPAKSGWEMNEVQVKASCPRQSWQVRTRDELAVASRILVAETDSPLLWREVMNRYMKS